VQVSRSGIGFLGVVASAKPQSADPVSQNGGGQIRQRALGLSLQG
jgi:hypothetical protein